MSHFVIKCKSEDESAVETRIDCFETDSETLDAVTHVINLMSELDGDQAIIITKVVI